MIMSGDQNAGQSHK